MTTDALRELRDQLHTELSGETPIDPERRALLLDVKTEIDHLIAREPATSELSAEDTQHLQGRLQSAAVSFEGSHPQLASTLERALLVLSNMGL
jgi:hypothetical protein